MGHTTPNNLKISIRLYELIKVAIGVWSQVYPVLPLRTLA
jgi:hypothetical protein